MSLALILIPLLAALLAFIPREDAIRRALLLAAATVHSMLTAALWISPPTPFHVTKQHGWLEIDSVGLPFLSLLSILFLLAALYSVGYLQREKVSPPADLTTGLPIHNGSETIFIACMLFFLAAMTTVTLSQHFGLLWVSMEATTLASAPLIYHHRQRTALEATWKYLLICSVGIALALMGNFLLAVSASHGPLVPGPLLNEAAEKEPNRIEIQMPQRGDQSVLILAELLAKARATAILNGKVLAESNDHSAHELPTPRPTRGLDLDWLKVAVLFFVVGYGTKMGLAPMHTALPDADSEAPSPVAVLLSGALLNCAFLGILRTHQVCVAAGEAEYSCRLLIGFGLASMAVAAIFVVGQTDFRRLLAYSSVEHMGIAALGVGLGGSGVYAAGFHCINHSLTKGALFLLAGNIVAAYGTKRSAEVRGMLRTLPMTGLLWLAGLLAITGAPPFGVFLSEFCVFQACVEQQRYFTAALFLALLLVIFIGVGRSGLAMAHGRAGDLRGLAEPREPWWAIVPPALLCAAALSLGLYMPPPVHEALRNFALALEGKTP